jgi:putative heme-binding domain-containing protein
MKYTIAVIFGRILLMLLVFLTVGSCGVLAQPGGVVQRVDGPAAIWAAGPLEVVAAFPAPVDPNRAKALVGQRISYFDFVEPDKEANVQLARREPRPPEILDGRLADRPTGALQIVGVRLADSGRTLMIATDPHPRMGRYVLPMGVLELSAGSKQRPGSEVSYDLCGVEWVWGPAAADPGEEPKAKGWWPSLDLETTRRQTKGSQPHEECMALLSQPGRLVLSTQLRLPEGTATVRLESTGSIEEATLGDTQGEPSVAKAPDELHRAELNVESKAEPVFLSFTVKTGQNRRPFALKVSYRMGGDKADRVLTRRQVIVPWAPVPPAQSATAPLVVPDLSGGDVARGQTLFSGEQARCSQCHTFRGQGGKIGPDLTDVGRKGRAEIYRNIAAPSAVIEADYTTYTVAANDGQVLVGVVRAEGAQAIRVTDTNAKSTVIARAQIQQIRPSATSIMPVGLAATLGDAAVRDLIAFLTTSP